MTDMRATEPEDPIGKQMRDIMRNAPTVEALAHPSLASLRQESAPALMILAGRSLALSKRAQDAEDRIQELERTVDALRRAVILLADGQSGAAALRDAIAAIRPDEDDDV